MKYLFRSARKAVAFAAGAVIALSLASCGGSGGGSASVPTPATPGISLLAGSIGGPGNIDVPGTAARFNQPRGITADGAGNLYVADSLNRAIRKIAPDGSVSTVIGGAPLFGADPPQRLPAVQLPRRVALDASGKVYFTIVAGAPMIFTPAPDGSFVNIGHDLFTWTASRYGPSDLPSEFVFDAAGDIYAADTLGHRITKMTPDGAISVLAGSGTAGSADGTGTAASFNAPAGLVLDPSGNLFVTDTVDDTVRKVTPAGVVTTIAGTPGMAGSADGTGGAARFNAPQGIALGADGTLYIADTGNATIRTINAAGVVATLAGSAGVTGADDGAGASARFAKPTDLAFGPGGNLYVVDADNNAIRRVTLAGRVDTAFGRALVTGSADGNGDAARFGTPRGLAHDAAGNVYVADTDNHVIRKIDPSGNVTTFAGASGQAGTADGSGAAARFRNPTGLAITPDGMLYVTDVADAVRGGGTVRRIAPDGAVTTFAGDPSAPIGSVTDGVGAAAHFSRPLGIASDAQGNLYVTDSYNLTTSDGKTIRRITPDAAVTTIAGAGAPCCTNLPYPNDGTGAAARFVAPSWIAAGPDGNVYVIDELAAAGTNKIIRKVTPAGQVSTLALSALGPVTIGGIAVDGDGSIYFTEQPADQWSAVLLRKLAPDGTITTVAGHPARLGVELGELLGSLDGLGPIAMLAPHTLAVTSTAAVLKVVAP